MALSFNGTSDNARLTGNANYSPATTLSVALWIYFPTGWNTDAYGRVYEVGGFGSSPQAGHDLEQNGSAANIDWNLWTTGTIKSAHAGHLTPTLDAWSHWLMTCDAGTTTVYIDGSSAGSNTSVTASSSSESPIFGQANTTGANRLQVRTAEFAVWDVALTAAEATSLYRGFSPMLVRPASLTAYVPMVNGAGAADRVLGGAFTLTGTSNASHPRIIYPRRKQVLVPTAAAAATTFGFLRDNAGLGLMGGGPFARANAGLGVLA